MRLALRNVLFTLIVPGAGAVYAPWLILTRSGGSPRPVAWPAVMLIIGGMLLYIACQWALATVGRGTPGPWDAPRRFVAVGPYRWVRNPIYIAALLVLVAEAWLFLSLPLLVYAVLAGIGCHLFVVVYEEPTLQNASARSTTCIDATFGAGFRMCLNHEGSDAEPQQSGGARTGRLRDGASRTVPACMCVRPATAAVAETPARMTRSSA